MNPLIQKALTASQGPLKGNEIKKINCISDGTIRQCWQIELGSGEKLFAKTGGSRSSLMFKIELAGLQALRKFRDKTLIDMPKPLALEQINGENIFLMTWLESGSGSQSLLGEGLAKLHKASAENNPDNFGWDQDGFIGAGQQPGGWEASWGECFVKLRLLPQLNLARKKWGLEIPNSQTLLTSLVSFLDKHNPSPSLVHGDLWSGNAFVKDDGRGVLLDPATWWADREVDLAMTKLFGGFSKEFYKSYQKSWPLESSSKDRVEIYNLYHLLNHANLFGGGYKNQCICTLNTLNRLINN